MKSKTAPFIGHRDCFGLSENLLKPAIEHLLEQGVTEFLNGGMGSFDWLCARTVYELKKSSHPEIHSYLVIPYLSFSIREKKYFDDIIYPEGFEKYHFKAAIPARNRYLVEHSAYAICYVDHDWGGAAKTYQRALRQGLTIINLADPNSRPCLSNGSNLGF